MHTDVMSSCKFLGYLIWHSLVPSLTLQVELLLWDGPRGGHAEVLPMQRGDAGSWSVKVGGLHTMNAVEIHVALHLTRPVHHSGLAGGV